MYQAKVLTQVIFSMEGPIIQFPLLADGEVMTFDMSLVWIGMSAEDTVRKPIC